MACVQHLGFYLVWLKGLIIPKTSCIYQVLILYLIKFLHLSTSICLAATTYFKSLLSLQWVTVTEPQLGSLHLIFLSHHSPHFEPGNHLKMWSSDSPLKVFRSCSLCPYVPTLAFTVYCIKKKEEEEKKKSPFFHLCICHQHSLMPATLLIRR